MFALFLTSPTTLPTVHPPSRRLCRLSQPLLGDGIFLFVSYYISLLTRWGVTMALPNVAVCFRFPTFRSECPPPSNSCRVMMTMLDGPIMHYPLRHDHHCTNGSALSAVVTDCICTCTTHAFDSPKREILEDMSNAVRVTCAGVLTRSRHVAISQKGPVRKQRPLEGRSAGQECVPLSAALIEVRSRVSAIGRGSTRVRKSSLKRTMTDVVSSRAVVVRSGIHYIADDSSTAQYLLVLDAINFCFWPGAHPHPSDRKVSGSICLCRSGTAIPSSVNGITSENGIGIHSVRIISY